MRPVCPAGETRRDWQERQGEGESSLPGPFVTALLGGREVRGGHWPCLPGPASSCCPVDPDPGPGSFTSWSSSHLASRPRHAGEELRAPFVGSFHISFGSVEGGTTLHAGQWDQWCPVVRDVSFWKRSPSPRHRNSSREDDVLSPRSRVQAAPSWYGRGQRRDSPLPLETGDQRQKKYGKKRFQAMAAKGRRKKA